ncbi:MAG TPA: hypothetical protein PKK23_16245 [Nitrospirales bacterium]|nr:hypothetical protein [Nitrospiraceae bacterium]HNP30597.1 hypothetical protein [Nitrospirales bacterium]
MANNFLPSASVSSGLRTEGNAGVATVSIRHEPFEEGRGDPQKGFMNRICVKRCAQKWIPERWRDPAGRREFGKSGMYSKQGSH